MVFKLLLWEDFRLNPLSGIVLFGNGVYSSLGQRLIRHEWEAFLPDVGLNKSLRTKAQCHFQRGQYMIGGRDESPPTALSTLIFTAY